MARRYVYIGGAGRAAIIKAQLTALTLVTATVHDGNGIIVVTIPDSAGAVAHTAWRRNQPHAALRIDNVPDATPNQTAVDGVEGLIAATMALTPVP